MARKTKNGKKLVERQDQEARRFWLQYGLDPVKMERFEKGEQTPTIEEVMEICRKTGMSADYLLLGEEAREQKILVIPGGLFNPAGPEGNA